MEGKGGMSEAASIDTFYLLYCGSLVFFMQAGFGLLEAGTVRSKNLKNILLKNTLDACIGAVVWWAWGFGMAYSHGENKFIGVANGDDGSDKFFLMGQVGSNEHATGYEYIYFFFQYVFAAHTSTIVGGAVTERCQLGAYFIYTFVIVGFIYPVVAHWVWAEHGWASAFTHSVGEVAFGGCIDFGGGAVVHLTGGMCALWGASVIGPRKGRYDDRGRLLPLPGHSSVLSVLGTLILWVCWYGFNPGSTLAISGDEGKTAARACVTTTLAGAGGGITVILLDKSIGSEVWEVSAVCNGVLAGLVSITAGCATVTSFSALFIGILGGAVYFLSSKLLAHKLKVDDPVDAFAVHGACGCFGVIANGFFADDFYTKHYYQWAQLESGGRPQWDPSYAGVFYGGSKVLGAAIVTCLAVVGWVSVVAAPMFAILRWRGMLRVSAEVEETGMDVSKHGGSAYTYSESAAFGAHSPVPSETSALLMRLRALESRVRSLECGDELGEPGPILDDEPMEAGDRLGELPGLASTEFRVVPPAMPTSAPSSRSSTPGSAVFSK